MDEQDRSPTILLHEEQEQEEEEEEEKEKEEEDTPNSDWLKLALATSSDRQPNFLSEAPPVTRRPQPRMLWSRGDSSDVTGGPQLRSETPEFFMRAPAFAPPGRPGVRMKVVSPPRRSQPGVWLILQAAQNQSGREPYLPQIAKNYLRIKDGRSTLSLLMKYLVKKLGLEDESEVEITCRDQQLHPLLRLQYVRDTIWCSGNSMMIMTANSPSNDHVMTLQYRRNLSPSANLIQQQPKRNYSTRSLQNTFQ